MSFSIDGQAVNARIDWKHQLAPEPPQGRREEEFPGILDRFIIKGKVRLPDVVVAGFLEGSGDGDAALQSLAAAVIAQHQIQNKTTPLEVTINGVTYSNCDLAAFNTTSQPEAIGGGKVRIGVRYVFRRLGGQP